jgi:hypothetical protein
MQGIVQTHKPTEPKSKRKDSSLVNGHPKDNEEKVKRPEKTIPKNEKQRNIKREQKEPIYQNEDRVPSSNKKEISRSWKQYCTATSPINPWNEVYKLATCKTRNKSTITTLQKTNGSKTANLTETLKLMLDKISRNSTPKSTDTIRRQ